MAREKIVSRDQAAAAAAAWRAAGQRVGFTSGAFDLLHAGHVAYLEQARALCDRLIVGVNSDQSVQRYKSPLRPLIPQDQRLAVVAGLQAVDLAFLFDEVNNHANIEALRPDLYIKAGDYDRAALTSAPVVESYGGKVWVAPFVPGVSTSEIIRRAAEIAQAGAAAECAIEAPGIAPAAFVDRDGTMIEHVEYLHEPEKLRPIPGALEALKQLRAAGFRIVVVTNQPGIGLGYYTKEDFFRVNLELLRAASKAGLYIDKVYFCPHSRADGCRCRKPATGMIERAQRELNVDPARSAVIGDMTIDMMLARNAGCTAILVETGYGGRDGNFTVTPDFTAPDLAAAAKWLLARRGGPLAESTKLS